MVHSFRKKYAAGVQSFRVFTFSAIAKLLKPRWWRQITRGCRGAESAREKTHPFHGHVALLITGHVRRGWNSAFASRDHVVRRRRELESVGSSTGQNVPTAEKTSSCEGDAGDRDGEATERR